MYRGKYAQNHPVMYGTTRRRLRGTCTVEQKPVKISAQKDEIACAVLAVVETEA